MNKFEDILRTKRTIEDDFLRMEGIHALSLGYEQLETSYSDEILLYFHVHGKGLMGTIIPEEIHGHRTAIIETEIPKPLSDSKKYNPLTGGIKIETEHLINGTLGCIVTDNISGKKAGLTCMHVLTNKSCLVGHPAFKQDSCIGNTVRGSLSKTIDAAIFSVPDSSNGLSITQIGVINGWHNLTLKDVKFGGFPIRKRGMATGLTFGLVKNLHYTGYRSDGWKFTDQLWIEGYENVFSSEGDSGSVYVDVYNRLIGLHWGCEGYHTGVGSPIGNIFLELNVGVDDNEGQKNAKQQEDLYCLVS